MKVDVSPFRAREGRPVNLKKHPTRVKGLYRSSSHCDELLAEHVRKLSQRQNLLYAHDRYSLLVILQAMDAAGKDGVIKHVMSGVNPQGCQVYSFKHPSAEELDHDFLWRTTKCLPERGRIGIFNRSYYEEVLVVRVHPEILQGQRLPDETLASSKIWKQRYRSIVDFETHLHRNGTRVVKCFLHISKDEQRRRLWRGSTIRTRTGSSAPPTWPSAIAGRTTCARTRSVWRPPAPNTRPGTSSPRTTRPLRG